MEDENKTEQDKINEAVLAALHERKMENDAYYKIALRVADSLSKKAFAERELEKAEQARAAIESEYSDKYNARRKYYGLRRAYIDAGGLGRAFDAIYSEIENEIVDADDPECHIEKFLEGRPYLKDNTIALPDGFEEGMCEAEKEEQEQHKRIMETAQLAAERLEKKKQLALELSNARSIKRGINKELRAAWRERVIREALLRAYTISDGLPQAKDIAIQEMQEGVVFDVDESELVTVNGKDATEYVSEYLAENDHLKKPPDWIPPELEHQLAFLDGEEMAEMEEAAKRAANKLQAENEKRKELANYEAEYKQIDEGNKREYRKLVLKHLVRDAYLEQDVAIPDKANEATLIITSDPMFKPVFIGDEQVVISNGDAEQSIEDFVEAWTYRNSHFARSRLAFGGEMHANLDDGPNMGHPLERLRVTKEMRAEGKSGKEIAKTIGMNAE